MQGDIFATKGAEYLIVIAYLILLVVMVRVMTPRRAPALAGAGARRRSRPGAWFALVDGYHYHRGHTWAAEGEGDVVTVGLDDFAAKLVGAPDGIGLPAVGTRVKQGEPGWWVRAGERTVSMVSPVDGRVVAVNDAVVASPRRAAQDPYGEGWLFKVEAPRRRTLLRNLLSGELAAVWMEQAAERLRGLPGGALGEVLPDGGEPVPGFGRALEGEEWDAVVREFFLTQ